MAIDISRSFGDIISQLFIRNFELKCSYDGHYISAVSDDDEVKLYIDGICVDKISLIVRISSAHSILRGTITVANRIKLVEVYGKSVWLGKPNIKICVDNLKIAGDNF